MATSYLSAILQPHSSLPNTDDIARYCSSTRFDHDSDVPKVGAFVFNGTPPELSVNHLQYYPNHIKCVRTQLGLSESDMIALVRQEVSHYLKLTAKGRFVVLNVGDIRKKAQRRRASLKIIYTPCPNEGKVSHSSIIPADSALDRTRTATILMRLSKGARTYPGVERS